MRSTPPERLNFFILLDLDPDAPWSDPVFQMRLHQKQNDWSRQANRVGSVKNEAQRNLKLVKYIWEVMLDADKRREEAKAARELLEARRIERFRQLDADIRFYQSDSRITRKEFDALKETYKDIISEPVLMTRLTQHGLTIIQNPVQTATTTPQRLGPVTEYRIREQLTFLSEDSLYTLLQAEAARSANPPGQPLGPESPLSLLQATAANLNKRMQESMDRGPENSSRKNLAGEAMVIFRNEEMRQKYNTTLRLEPLDRLIEDLARLCQPEGRVTAQRAEYFLRLAREAGITMAEAEAALNKLIQDRKWPPLASDGSTGDPRIFVSHSHQDAQFCHELVQALRAAGANVWYDEHDLGSGELGPTIERELRARPVFIVILSPAALQSHWVEDETRWAYGLYRTRTDASRTILPVLAAPVNEEDIWLFLQSFKRIEAPGGQPYPQTEAIGRVVAAMRAIK